VAGNASASPFGNLPGPVPDLVCYSHLRWNFVFQRPQHLMTRFTKHLRVFFVEEPHWDAAPDGAWLEVQTPRPNLWVVVPHLPDNLERDEQERTIGGLLTSFFAENRIGQFIGWYYTPMALGFSSHLEPLVTVYDCMDELSAFRGAPPLLLDRETELFGKATSCLRAARASTKPSANGTAACTPSPAASKGRTLPRPARRSPIPTTRPPFRTRDGLLRRARRTVSTLNCCAAWPPPGPTGTW
jgi:UDP-galactopyranose mutase